jgi:AraC-like DNA-binding protein
MQRAASLLPLPALLAELGIEIDAVLDGTGVSAEHLRPDAFIPYAAFLAVLDKACSLSGRNDIGMLLGKRQTLAALGPLGSVLRHAATLGDAIAEFAAFQRNNSTGGTVYVMRAQKDVILGYGVYDATAVISPQIYDLVLAVGCNLIAELTGGAEGPEEIHLSRPQPGDPTPYRRLGGCPVRFGQNQTGLLLRGSTLAFPLPAADSDLHDQALSRLLSGSVELSRDMAGRVRHLLRPQMLMGQAGMEDVARRLDVHPRALRRRLRQDGTTFAAIRDEVRYAAAREFLMLGALGITDIAVALDYATASSFVHAFRRWSGVSPGAWRAGRADRGNPDRPA